MKKLVILFVLLSTVVQGSNGVIPGKGTGDRVLIEDTFKQKRLDYLGSIDYHLAQKKKRGYKVVSQTNSGYYTVITFENSIRYESVTFKAGKYVSSTGMFK